MTKTEKTGGVPGDQFFDPVIIWRRWNDRSRMIREEIARRRTRNAGPVAGAARDAGHPSRRAKRVAAVIAAIVAGLIVAWAVGRFAPP